MLHRIIVYSLGFYLLTVVLIIHPQCYAIKAPHVAFLNPATAENAFWEKMTRLMRAAAQDLGVKLSVHYMKKSGITNRFAYFETAEQLTATTPKPDYLLYINLKGTGLKILQTADTAGIVSFIFNSDILASKRSLFGWPRGRYKTWIGHQRPNDEMAGAQLLGALIDSARANQNTRDISVIALNGSHNSSSALQRGIGLTQRLKTYDQRVSLNQMTNSNAWTHQEGFNKSRILLQRFPATKVIWAASDSLAFGAISAIQAIGQRPGQDVLTGGIDWTDEAFKRIQNGVMTATVGGHFLGGGFAIILLFDYHNGFDFAADSSAEVITDMYAITAKNINACAPGLLQASFAQIDFKSLSLAYNRKLTRHNYYDLVKAVINPACQLR